MKTSELGRHLVSRRLVSVTRALAWSTRDHHLEQECVTSAQCLPRSCPTHLFHMVEFCHWLLAVGRPVAAVLLRRASLILWLLLQNTKVRKANAAEIENGVCLNLRRVTRWRRSERGTRQGVRRRWWRRRWSRSLASLRRCCCVDWRVGRQRCQSCCW